MMIDRMLILSQKISALQTCDDRGEDGSGKKAVCSVYTVQLYSGHRVYTCTVQYRPAPTGSGVTRVRAGQSEDRPRPVSRQRRQADIGHLIGSSGH